MKADTIRKAAFIESPLGEFYRVDYFDEDENVVHFSDENSGDEHTSSLEELEGWTGYKLTPIEE